MNDQSDGSSAHVIAYEVELFTADVVREDVLHSESCRKKFTWRSDDTKNKQNVK